MLGASRALCHAAGLLFQDRVGMAREEQLRARPTGLAVGCKAQVANFSTCTFQVFMPVSGVESYNVHIDS